ncbi:MAG: PAS domain S-box protein [Desulfotignum sp.]|jgi:PAS domain S-box-containing protein|nr:PAS domain S-box protein [Desulfotignum sp.]
MSNKPTYEALEKRVQQLETRLQASEIRYKTLFDVLPIGITVSDHAGSIVESNAVAEKILGLSRQEHTQRKIDSREWQIVREDGSPMPAGEYASTRALKENRLVENIEMGIRKHKEPITWITVNAAPIPLEGYGVAIAYIDITHINRIKDKLKKKNQLLQTISDNMLDLVAVTDLSGNFTFVGASHKILGYGLDALMGKNVLELVHPDDLPEVTLAFKEFLAEEKDNPKVEYRYRCADGSYLWFETIGRFITDDTGTAREILFNTRNITERKHNEQALRKQESLLQKIFDILPIGLWFADKNGTLLRGNPMGVKIWGAEPKVPISEYGVFRAWHLPSRTPVDPDDWALAKTIREGVTIMDELLEIEAFDGRRKTILNYTAPVRDDNGEVDGAIVVNLDISDRMALETELAEARKMESVGRLAGGVAHDFNNMLTVILGYTQAAMEEVDPSGQMYASLREVHNAATRSADLTRQLLTFARKQMIHPEVLDVNRTVDSLLNMLDRLIGEDIDMIWQPTDDLWPVKMDPAQINQILTSLCTNARDAVSGRGTLTIKTDKTTFDPAFCKDHKAYVPGDFVRLAVSDTGCGMDEKTLENLFEPFYTTKDVGEGTGLGLASVYGIVQQNNGFIHVSSASGTGTTFHIYLPRYRSAPHSAAPAQGPSERSGNG